MSKEGGEEVKVPKEEGEESKVVAKEQGKEEEEAKVAKEGGEAEVAKEGGEAEVAKEGEEVEVVAKEEKKPRMIELLSSDNETFVVEEAVAIESQTIKHMIEDDCADSAIPLPNVTGAILAKVIEYCKKHVQNPGSEDELKAFDADFVKVDQATLFEVILAANYLNIKGLLDLTCQTVADLIKNMSVEEVRDIFNIKNDFTAEEEAEIRKENAWAFE